MLVLDRGFSGILSRQIDDYPEGIVVVINKPYRWTSADVIRKVKFAAIRHFNKKNLKVGHAGTLDPLAEGVLLVCIGNACKQAQALQASDKEYVADVCFGATTASFDLEKEVDLSCPLEGVSKEALEEVLAGFIGEQDQVAPLFSAKLVGGVRAYELARKIHRAGGQLDEAAKELLSVNRIKISEMELMEWGVSGSGCFAGPEVSGGTGASSRINVASVPAGLPAARIRVECSKGTYIRALARDLGESLGSGAFLSSLCRSRSGAFRVENAASVEDIISLLREGCE